MTVRDLSFLAPLMAVLLPVAHLPYVSVYRTASASPGPKRSGKTIANFKIRPSLEWKTLSLLLQLCAPDQAQVQVILHFRIVMIKEIRDFNLWAFDRTQRSQFFFFLPLSSSFLGRVITEPKNV